jgi:hypothetical protein
LTAGLDVDQGGTGRRRRITHDTRRVHVIDIKILDESRTKVIVADAAHHGHLAAEASRGDRLVCALAARVTRETIAEDRFAGVRQTQNGYDKIHVKAAQDDNSGRQSSRQDATEAYAFR